MIRGDVTAADRMSSFGDFIALSDICDVPTARVISREVRIDQFVFFVLIHQTKWQPRDKEKRKQRKLN